MSTCSYILTALSQHSALNSIILAQCIEWRCAIGTPWSPVSVSVCCRPDNSFRPLALPTEKGSSERTSDSLDCFHWWRGSFLSVWLEIVMFFDHVLACYATLATYRSLNIILKLGLIGQNKQAQSYYAVEPHWCSIPLTTSPTADTISTDFSLFCSLDCSPMIWSSMMPR